MSTPKVGDVVQFSNGLSWTVLKVYPHDVKVRVTFPPVLSRRGDGTMTVSVRTTSVPLREFMRVLDSATEAPKPPPKRVARVIDPETGESTVVPFLDLRAGMLIQLLEPDGGSVAHGDPIEVVMTDPRVREDGANEIRCRPATPEECGKAVASG